jgi:hypothetical protein
MTQAPSQPPLGTANPFPQAGCYGVSHGAGLVGELIRHATESWAGHAFLYIGNGLIIEAAPPATRISPVGAHPDAVWNSEEPLTGAQRTAICNRAHALLGTPYDYPAYIGFALEVLKLGTAAELDPVFTHDHWRVCSADVADEYRFGGIEVTRGLKYPNLVSPADLYNRIAQRSWGHA